MALARLRDRGGEVPMAVAGTPQGTGFGTTDTVVEGILQRIAQLRDEQQRQGEVAAQQGGEPELTQAQLDHAAGLARMLGNLERWGGPRW